MNTPSLICSLFFLFQMIMASRSCHVEIVFSSSSEPYLTYTSSHFTHLIKPFTPPIPLPFPTLTSSFTIIHHQHYHHYYDSAIQPSSYPAIPIASPARKYPARSFSIKIKIEGSVSHALPRLALAPGPLAPAPGPWVGFAALVE